MRSSIGARRWRRTCNSDIRKHELSERGQRRGRDETDEFAIVKMSFSRVVFVTLRSQEMRATNGDIVGGAEALFSL